MGWEEICDIVYVAVKYDLCSETSERELSIVPTEQNVTQQLDSLLCSLTGITTLVVLNDAFSITVHISRLEA